MDWGIVGKILYDWQTLIGAILALIVAVVTIVVMNGQRRDEIERHKQETERQHDADRRKKMAVRAAMPDALSSLSQYARECGERLTGRADALPDPPVQAMSTLQAAVEFIDDDAAKRTFELVSWYQVVSSRLASGVPRTRNASYGEAIYDLALMQAYVNSLFEYARNETDDVTTNKPNKTEMISGLRNAFDMPFVLSHEELFQGGIDLLHRRHPD